MRDLDTTNLITILCDADKRSISSMLTGVSKGVTVGQLQSEYLSSEKYNEFVIAMRYLFTPVLEQATKTITELWDKIKDVLQQPIESFCADYRRARQRSRNNYRKLKHLPLSRRPRCRWRQRESRRKLEGLSPGAVIFDEFAFEEEV